VSLVIGIDPGLSGALAVLDGTGEVRRVAARVVIERVSAMPKQGVSSTFTFGVAFGSILGAVQALNLPIEFVTPVTWKRALGLSSDKKAALHKARLMFPYAEINLEKHHGRAEALLIAHWAQRHSLQARTAA
jgi:crossover junction endodeoxyribonuclease RuvC